MTDPLDRGVWARFAASGFPVPSELVDPAVGGRLVPGAPGVEVTAAQIGAAPVEVAVWLAGRAADPEVVFSAARDRRRAVQVAAVWNPRCPLDAIRDVVLGSSPVVELPAVAAVRFDAETLTEMVCTRGPLLVPRSGWPVPFTVDQLARMSAATPPSLRGDLLERVVFRAVARWVRTGDPGGFEVSGLAALVPSAGGEASWERRTLGSAVASELGDLGLVPGEVAGRVAALEELPVGGGPLRLGDLVPPVPLDEAAVACFARSGSVSLFARALAEGERLSAGSLELLAAEAHDGERFGLLLRALEDHLCLWSRLSPRARTGVAVRVEAPGMVRRLAPLVLADEGVDLDARVGLFAREPAVPDPDAVGAGFAETWVAFARRVLAAGDRGRRLLWALRVAHEVPVLAAGHRELVWELIDEYDGSSGPWASAAEVAALVAATAPVPAERFARWLVRFPELLELQGCRGFGELSPAAAAGVLAEVVAAGDGFTQVLQSRNLVATFADLVDQDPVGAELLGSLRGVVPDMVRSHDVRVVAPLARRLAEAGVAADGWRLAVELAVDWPGTLVDLVATVAAATDPQPAVR